jgi:hypothetical protein
MACVELIKNRISFPSTLLEDQEGDGRINLSTVLGR